MKRWRIKMPASLAKLAPTTIREKLTLWFLLLSLAPIFAIAFMAYTSSRASLEKEIYNKLDAVADNKSYILGIWFKEQLSQAAALTANDAIKDLLSPSFRIVYPDLAAKTDAERMRRVKDIITARQETNTSYIDVMIADTEGNIVASSSKSLLQQGKNLKDLGAPGIPEGDTFHITPAFFSNAAQLHVMMIIQPIHDNNAKIIGRVVLEVDLRPVNRLIEERSGLGESGEVIIVDRARRLLTPSRSSEESTILKPLPDSDPISRGLQDQKGHDISNDYRGVPVIAAYRPLPEIGAALIAKIDQSEGLAPIIQLRNVMAVIGLLTLFVAAAASVALA
ncbi:MAG TPA: cache domain-containing protein, partial [Candidatus Binatia bacterium]